MARGRGRVARKSKGAFPEGAPFFFHGIQTEGLRALRGRFGRLWGERKSSMNALKRTDEEKTVASSEVIFIVQNAECNIFC